MLRWNMTLHIPFAELTSHRHGQRSSTINLAWAMADVVVNYYEDLDLVGSDNRAQLISIKVASIARGI
jgi:hypothetical protein